MKLGYLFPKNENFYEYSRFLLFVSDLYNFLCFIFFLLMK